MNHEKGAKEHTQAGGGIVLCDHHADVGGW